MLLSRFAKLSAVIYALLGCSYAAAAASASVTVHIQQPGAVIDRHVYGQFAEHLGHGIYEGIWVGEHSSIPNIHGFRSDVIEALRQLKVPVVRWPGGCFADEYHWRDGVGPRDRRPVTVNTNWGGVAESNGFGTHEFMEFVELIGADAYINGNLGSGSPREMAEWLQYLTSDQESSITAERARNGHPKPWKVAFFGIGNELWGCGGNMTPDYYADEFGRYVAFLKSPPGTRPQIIASGGHDADTSWTDTLAARSPEGTSAVTFHYYTLPGTEWKHKGAATGFNESEWISTFAHTMVIEDYISQNVEKLKSRDPANKIGFSIDEWGTWYDTEPGREPGFLYQQNTLRDALVAATNFNIFHHHADRIHMTNIAQMVNVLQAMILTDGPRMVLTPTYHVFSMFKPFQDATYIPTDVETSRYQLGEVSVPTLNVSAARTSGGDVIVALVNLDPHRALPANITFPGSRLRTVTASVLTASAMDAHNSFDTPHAIQPKAFADVRMQSGQITAQLPPKSLVLLTVR